MDTDGDGVLSPDERAHARNCFRERMRERCGKPGRRQGRNPNEADPDGPVPFLGD